MKPKLFNENPKTLGEHLKKRRCEMGLMQKAVAKKLRVNQFTLINWEKDRTGPEVRYLPRIIAFLGYDPFPHGQSLGGRITARRRTMGLSIKRLAKVLGFDEGTLAHYETGLWNPNGKRLVRIERFLTETTKQYVRCGRLPSAKHESRR